MIKEKIVGSLVNGVLLVLDVYCEGCKKKLGCNSKCEIYNLNKWLDKEVLGIKTKKQGGK